MCLLHDIETEDAGPARGRCLQGRQDPDGSGLAGPVGSEKSQDRAGRDPEGHAINEYQHLMTRIDPKKIEVMVEENKQSLLPSPPGGGAGGEGATPANAQTLTDRTAQAFLVPADEIRANKYDLSLNRYQEAVHEVVRHDPPQEILARMKALQAEIVGDLAELEGML